MQHGRLSVVTNFIFNENVMKNAWSLMNMTYPVRITSFKQAYTCVGNYTNVGIVQSSFWTVFPLCPALLGPKILSALAMSHSVIGQFDSALLLTYFAKTASEG